VKEKTKADADNNVRESSAARKERDATRHKMLSVLE
jgi:hypothetical protein